MVEVDVEKGTMQVEVPIPTSTVTKRGQTTVPAKIRELMKLQTGSVLVWKPVDGRVEVSKKKGKVK